MPDDTRKPWSEATGPRPVPRGTPDAHAQRRIIATLTVEEMIKSGHVRSFFDLWVQFERKMLKGDRIDEIQRVEMRRAFYAGGSAMFYYILGLSGPADVTEDAGAARLDQLQQELERWIDMLRAGEV